MLIQARFLKITMYSSLKTELDKNLFKESTIMIKE
ncbi:hypothetical protein Xish_01300 [Xenorhabdus ishibashii]|uniref:Uncharacterized protein n=1 Tax=Xenorhabdus ishibashii TaxID=1034471 RepID=A0A2D0KFH5_9GAMM|nr:hypothetical protein Xish_01300 [Xenorhabdus ishibashii]